MSQNPKSEFLFEQVIPLILTVAVFLALTAVLFFVIMILNHSPLKASLALELRWRDILVGATVYFKTSVDFALLIGFLMKTNQGWKNRIAIEFGTALGNGIGTILILTFWVVFRELHFLLALMIFLSALVLFELADHGLENFHSWTDRGIKRTIYKILNGILEPILKFTRPLTSRILPNFSKKLQGDKNFSWKSLLIFSLTVPFILGLDDFAGYVPLFSLVNVFGFAVGVMAAHMLLNIGLFLNPEATIKWVKNQWVAFVGTVAFIGLAIFGIIEAIRILI